MPDLLINESGILIDEWETGLDFLGDLVVKNLLNKVTTALYSPDFGTELRILPQRNISDEEFKMKFAMLISQIEGRIKREQEITPASADEMLDRIIIRNLYKNEFGRWQAYLRVYSLTDQSFDIAKQLTD